MRRHFIFRGYVQGVGFRYTARYAAELCGVTGYVRNCYDGSVEMEAEGSEEAIKRMLLIISNGEYIEITDMESEDIPEKNDSYFEIK